MHVCQSVKSVWELDLRSLTLNTPRPTLGKKVGTDPSFTAGVSASILAPESVYVCVHTHISVCACMYMGNLCANMYKGRGSLSHRGWGREGCSRQGCLGGSSQVDPPQVSRCCDRVALRAQLLGTLWGGETLAKQNVAYCPCEHRGLQLCLH